MKNFDLKLYKETHPADCYVLELATAPYLFSKKYYTSLGAAMSSFRNDLLVEFNALKKVETQGEIDGMGYLSEDGRDKLSGLKELKNFGFFD